MVSISNQNQEQIIYNGQKATVVSRDAYSGTLTVQLDNGEYITVDENDLFGMNNNIKKSTDYIDKRIAELNTEIEENNENVKKNNKLWNVAKRVILKCRADINSLLSSLHIVSATQITKEEDKEKYKALLADKDSARKTQLRASSEIMSDTSESIGFISTKHNYELNKIYAKYQSEKFGLVQSVGQYKFLQ